MDAFIEWTLQFPDPVGLTLSLSACAALCAAVAAIIGLITEFRFGGWLVAASIAGWVVGCWLYAFAA